MQSQQWKFHRNFSEITILYGKVFYLLISHLLLSSSCHLALTLDVSADPGMCAMVSACGCPPALRAAFPSFFVPDSITFLTQQCFRGLDFWHSLHAFDGCTLDVPGINVLILIRIVSWHMNCKLVPPLETHKRCTEQKEIFQPETKQQTFYWLGQKMASVKLTWQNCYFWSTRELMKRKVQSTRREHGRHTRLPSGMSVIRGTCLCATAGRCQNHIT